MLCCSLWDIFLVQQFVAKGADNFKKAIKHASRNGNNEVIEYLLSKTVDCVAKRNQGLIGAARGGHTSLVMYFIRKGANNWNLALFQAAKGGHLELVQFILTKGAQDPSAVEGAILGRNYRIINLLLDTFQNKCKPPHYNRALRAAAIIGDMDLIIKLQTLGATDWEAGLRGACRGGYMHVIDFFIALGANDFNKGLLEASMGGHMEIIEYLTLKKSSWVPQEPWEIVLIGAVSRSRMNLVDYAIRTAGKDVQCTKASKKAAKKGFVDLVESCGCFKADCNCSCQGRTFGTAPLVHSEYNP